MAKAGGVKVLIVEDEIIIAREIEDNLTDMGYTVLDIVSNGKDAVEKAEELQPDIIFMDIILEGDMTGIEATIEIEKRMSVPVIYLTAHTDLGTLMEARETEPYGYITKPFNRKDLLVSIGMGLYKHRSDMKTNAMSSTIKLLLSSQPVNERLDLSLDYIFSVPNLVIKSKGAVFVVKDEPDTLILATHQGLNEETLNKINKIPFGKCHAGKAASEGAIIQTEETDECFGPGQEEGESCGHYCVPFIHHNRIIGVMHLFMEKGVKASKRDDEFFTSIADILAILCQM